MSFRKSLTRAGVLVSIAIAIPVGFSARAEVSDDPATYQPHIESIKKELESAKSDSDAAAPTESYSEHLRQEILRHDQEDGPPGDSTDYSESLRAKIRKQDLEDDIKPAEGSYSQDLKVQVEKADAEQDPDEKLPDSAIQAVSEGKSDLKLKRRGAIHHAFGFRMGNQSSFAIANSLNPTASFFNLYSQGWAPNFGLFYEYQPFHSEWFGNIGIFGNASGMFYSGFGSFQYPVPQPIGSTKFSTQSQTSLSFGVIPVTVGLNYRFNLMRILRPFVMVGPTVIGFYESRSDSQSGNRTFSTGYQINLGVSLLLDWFDHQLAWNQYSENGVKKFYLTVEYIRLATLTGDVNVSTSGIFGGLTFEF